MSSSPAPRLGGNLSVLPVELVFNVLDKLLLDTGHTGLCAVRTLRMTSHACREIVFAYLQSHTAFEYLNGLKWFPSFPGTLTEFVHTHNIQRVPIDGCPETGPDLITSTILEDCPHCLDWISKHVRRDMHVYSLNQHGWEVLAIAAHARAVRMFKYFSASAGPGYYKEFLSTLGFKANVLVQGLQTTAEILCQREDTQSFERCFDVLEPLLLATKHWNVEEDAIAKQVFTSENLLTICRYASPALARRLEIVGLPLHSIIYCDNDGRLRNGHASTTWHAAVLNGPDFLDYVRENNETLPKCQDSGGDTPLMVAIRANRVDSVLWLTQHSHSGGFLPIKLRDAVMVTTQLTSKESSECLCILLCRTTAYASTRLHKIHELLSTLITSTRLAALSYAVESFVDQDAYQKMRDELELRAIAKCGLIMQWPRTFRHSVAEEESLKNTEKCALSAGFERLACMIHSMGIWLDVAK